jgi:hypothetical protein
MDDEAIGEPVDEWFETLALPLQTLPYSYCGNLPMIHTEGPRAGFRVYRIRKDWTPRTPEWLKARIQQDWRYRSIDRK